MIESGKDIITPACMWGDSGIDYDQNAWRGPRKHPKLEGSDQHRPFVPGPIREEGTLFVSELEDEGEFVELDSVGGTVLFVKTEIYRNGISFPPFNLVGTDWDAREGFDGIETEGLCYAAKSIGYKCWAMPHERISFSNIRCDTHRRTFIVKENINNI